MDTKFSDYFSVKLMWSRIPHLIKKIPITLELAGLAFLVSIVVGLLIAVIRYKKVKILSPIATAFLSLMRGTPMLIQLYVAYYGIPAILRIFNSWGANIDVNIIPKMVYAFVALGLYQAAFTSEIFRAALESVDKGEIEAATAMGMTYPQVLRRIIVPEALENALPGICNSVIGLVKGTSLASTCGIYWVITVILEKIFKLIERRFRIPEQPKAVEAAEEV